MALVKSAIMGGVGPGTQYEHSFQRTIDAQGRITTLDNEASTEDELAKLAQNAAMPPAFPGTATPLQRISVLGLGGKRALVVADYAYRQTRGTLFETSDWVLNATHREETWYTFNGTRPVAKGSTGAKVDGAGRAITIPQWELAFTLNSISFPAKMTAYMPLVGRVNSASKTFGGIAIGIGNALFMGFSGQRQQLASGTQYQVQFQFVIDSGGWLRQALDPAFAGEVTPSSFAAVLEGPAFTSAAFPNLP